MLPTAKDAKLAGMASSYQPLRGTQDRWPHEERVFQTVRETARICATQLGFQPIATPIIEPISTFEKPLGASSDVVGKEMYLFEDRSGAPLVLRPEGTAGMVRAFLNDRPYTPQRLLYEGPM